MPEGLCRRSENTAGAEPGLEDSRATSVPLCHLCLPTGLGRSLSTPQKNVLSLASRGGSDPGPQYRGALGTSAAHGGTTASSHVHIGLHSHSRCRLSYSQPFSLQSKPLALTKDNSNRPCFSSEKGGWACSPQCRLSPWASRPGQGEPEGVCGDLQSELVARRLVMEEETG